MDTPPNSMGNDVSNRAMMLQGHRLKGPPTLSSMDYPEKQNLENDTPRGSDASQNRSTFDLARRNEGPATAVSHSLASRPWGLETQQDLHKVVKDDGYERSTSPNHCLAPSTSDLKTQQGVHADVRSSYDYGMTAKNLAPNVRDFYMQQNLRPDVESYDEHGVNPPKEAADLCDFEMRRDAMARDSDNGRMPHQVTSGQHDLEKQHGPPHAVAIQ